MLVDPTAVLAKRLGVLAAMINEPVPDTDRLAHLCPGCGDWSVEHVNGAITFQRPTMTRPDGALLGSFTSMELTWTVEGDILRAVDLAEQHRTECPALDMLAALRLPIGGA